MKIKATQKFVRMSPSKLRLVADMVRPLEPEEAIEILPHVQKRAAAPLLKAIKTAVANAKDQKITDDLKFYEIQINEGPRLKRGRPVSRLRWHPYQRKMSHIRIILETVEKNDKSVRGTKDIKSIKGKADEKTVSTEARKANSKVKSQKSKLQSKIQKGKK